MTPKLIAVLVLCVLLIAFTLQNAEVISVRFLFWEVRASLVIVIGAAILGGALAGIGLASFIRRTGRTDGPRPPSK